MLHSLCGGAQRCGEPSSQPTKEETLPASWLTTMYSTLCPRIARRQCVGAELGLHLRGRRHYAGRVEELGVDDQESGGGGYPTCPCIYASRPRCAASFGVLTSSLLRIPYGRLCVRFDSRRTLGHPQACAVSATCSASTSSLPWTALKPGQRSVSADPAVPKALLTGPKGTPSRSLADPQRWQSRAARVHLMCPQRPAVHQHTKPHSDLGRVCESCLVITPDHHIITLDCTRFRPWSFA